MSYTTPSPSVESTDASNATLSGVHIPPDLFNKFPISIAVALLETAERNSERHIAMLTRQNAALVRVLSSLVPPGLVEAILADAEMGQ
jgi:hypothetical protein